MWHPGSQCPAVEHPHKGQVVGKDRLAGDLRSAVRPGLRAADHTAALPGNLLRPSNRFPRSQAVCRCQDGALNRRVPGTTAECVLERVAYLRRCRLRCLFEQRRSGHDLTWDAEPTLDRAVHQKGLLQGVQPVVRRQPFDRLDRSSVRFEGGIGAGQDGRLVYQHRACPAFGLVASDLRPGQPETFAQHLREHLGRPALEVHLNAVHGQREGHLIAHALTPAGAC